MGVNRLESSIVLGRIRCLQLDLIGLSKKSFLLQRFSWPLRGRCSPRTYELKDIVYMRLRDRMVLDIEET